MKQCHNQPRILFLHLEFPNWSQGRHWSYSGQLGLEEGMQANGIHFVSVTTPWLRRAPEMFRAMKFDQVWVEIVHNPLDDTLLDWIASVAPVRVGFLGESLEHTPEECQISPLFASRKKLVESRLRYMTHALVVDDHDVEEINASGSAVAMWWPQAVPERCISSRTPITLNRPAVFSGAAYHMRADLLELRELKGLMVKQPSSEAGTLYPQLFDALHLAIRHYLRHVNSAGWAALSTHILALRILRRRCFARWLRSMREGCAVVNLPSVIKTYAGRVPEAMAAGVPVISWQIPDRPRTKELFESGKEILLFSKDDPAQLAEHIRRIQREPEFAQRLAASARQKLVRFHTIERRVRDIFDWIENGTTPSYS
jgi:hypothetical protein